MDEDRTGRTNGETIDDDNYEQLEQVQVFEDTDEYDDDEEALERPLTVFNKHRGSVFCGELNGMLAVTGGEDDQAYVWNIATEDIVINCTGHKDSVIAASFNHNKRYLATGDMSGVIKFWKCEDKTQVFETELLSDLSWIHWHPSANVFVAAGIDGNIMIYKIPSGQSKVFLGRGSKTEAGLIMTDGRSLVACYDDGWVNIFDMHSGLTKKATRASSNSLLSVAYCSTRDLILTGDDIGNVYMIMASTGQIVAFMNTTVMMSGENLSDNDSVTSTESVIVIDGSPHSPTLAAASNMAGLVCIWDLSYNVKRHVISLGSGVIRLVAHKGFIYAACLGGSVYQINSLSGEVIKEIKTTDQDILDISLDSDNMLITTDDGKALIYDVRGDN